MKIREKAIQANFHSKAEIKQLHDELTDRAKYIIKLRRNDNAKGKVGWKPNRINWSKTMIEIFEANR